MQWLNESVFLWIHHAGQGQAWLMMLATLLAKYTNWVFALSALAYLLIQRWYATALRMLLTAMLALALTYIITHGFYHPRPFVLGLGELVMPHGDSSSFPSRHLCFFWSLSLALALSPRTRRLGMVVTVLGLVEAWARIYVGVHFPLDMMGSLAVAACSAILVGRISYWRRYAPVPAVSY